MNRDTFLAIGLANESIPENGWVKIAPYGESIKERIVKGESGQLTQEKFIQRLDRSAAQAMVDKYKSIWNLPKRFIRGLPVFKHHPDLNDHAPGTLNNALANDRREYGQFSDLEAREDGFYGRIVLSEAGQAAVENEGLKYLSPFWWAKITGWHNGHQVAVPFELISAGLTDSPNIHGGQPLANETIVQTNVMDRLILINLLRKYGFTIADDCSDADLTTACDAALQKGAGVGVLENLKTNLENEKTTLLESSKELQKVNETIAQEKAKLEGDRNTLQAALGNERASRIELMLDLAIKDGRITAAQRPAWKGDLEKDFETKSAALSNEKAAVKTEAVTSGLGSRRGEVHENESPSQTVVRLANERMESKGETWDQAYLAIKHEQPGLFDSMKSPSKK